MADLSTSVSTLDKLNASNYSTWSTRLQFYLLGQDLWEIVGGMEDELLQHVKDAKTPKEAWDNLAGVYTRKNDVKLQQLENELLSVSQQDLTVNQYFSKVKSLCQEISKFDPESKITEKRMRRIITHGLRTEFNALATATRGWSKEPTLNEFENVLANQEELDKQMSKTSVKEEERALFSRKNGKDPQRVDRTTEEERQCKKIGVDDNKKGGHYARDRWYKNVQGIVASTHPQVDTEEELDFQASAAVSDNLVNYDNDWIFDSGCSNHMSGDKEKFLNMLEYKGE
ncbi:uncharacterized protein LOC126661823 [Mercurialis annua]|uniref:uncharacterized protein LOC126661823 n=1 Tax=Mercurialis annua TaxID=3986 RepID=UPI00215DE985|nr:uncharacterized protein LOC126661823 [Mercurialis annua]